MENLGEKPFRSKQLYSWVQKRFARGFDEMTDLPEYLRKKLENSAFLGQISIVDKKIAQDNTIKYLLEIEKHIIIEAALMYYRHGAALCVSTQAGCAMGCAFCASGKGGLIRNLTAGEMLSQAHMAILDTGKPISNITLMGAGEPLDNYENVLRFIRLATDKDGLGIGGRRLTLSTVGLTDAILALAEEKLQITLAVSLHAPNDRVRALFLPVTRAYPMDELLAACRKYAEITKRRISFEYAMIQGRNDRTDQAAELASKLKNMLCHVNLIPVNAGAGGGKSNFKPSPEGNIAAFRDVLVKNGIETTVRRTLGSGINAACGQLVGARVACPTMQ